MVLQWVLKCRDRNTQDKHQQKNQRTFQARPPGPTFNQWINLPGCEVERDVHSGCFSCHIRGRKRYFPTTSPLPLPPTWQGIPGQALPPGEQKHRAGTPSDRMGRRAPCVRHQTAGQMQRSGVRFSCIWNLGLREKGMPVSPPSSLFLPGICDVGLDDCVRGPGAGEGQGSRSPGHWDPVFGHSASEHREKQKDWGMRKGWWGTVTRAGSSSGSAWNPQCLRVLHAHFLFF